MTQPLVDVVVPSIGRVNLAVLLLALARGDGPAPNSVLVVDDRRTPDCPLLDTQLLAGLSGALDVRVLVGAGRGPAAARNVGWRAARAAWVAFLDDDVVPDFDWPVRLDADLRGADPDVGGVQGQLRVPLPSDRQPTDWERNVAGLATAQWATADLAYRRDVLAEMGGFDERFPRAYREDADLGLRVTAAGWRIVAGRRTAAHPVRPAGRWVSVALQRGNADDALMQALHGRDWRARAGVPAGRRPRHLATTAAGVAALGCLAAGRPGPAAVLAAGWLAGTTELAWARIAPGPRTRAEVTTMAATSVALPFAASWHWLRGLLSPVRPLEGPPRLHERPANGAQGGEHVTLALVRR